MKKSIFTQRIEPCALGQSTVLSQAVETTQTVNISLPDGVHLVSAQADGTGQVVLDNSSLEKSVCIMHLLALSLISVVLGF